ncbi:McrC family protein [Persicitalea sp.]|uniref:McrC family protein n=1 Tax=Persicitalea sp. TaxID=3100273 RepID=UPI00359324E8
MLHLATENATITYGTNADPKALVLPEAAFLSLKNYALRDDAEPVLRYSVQRGRASLRVGAYVGLLQASGSMGIEILPKITDDFSPESVTAARLVLLRMLLAVPELRLIPVPEVRLSKLASFPLPDALAALFLQRVAKLLHRGLPTDYRPVETERPFVKGKLRLQSSPLALTMHPERLPVAFAERSRDHAPNRLLKACLHRLRAGAFARLVRQYLFSLEEIPAPRDWRDDLRLARQQNRTFRDYVWLWPWADWLLGGAAPAVGADRDLLPGLLFPTQFLFENYVARSLRKYLPAEYAVSTQESPHHLLYDAAGHAAHRLRPDLVVRRGEDIWVLDTKWKLVQGNGSQVSNLAQSDLYQLYAYGQRYAQDSGSVKLALIYPKTEDFTNAPQPFSYEPHLPLHLLPADLSLSPAKMVEQLWEGLESQSFSPH